MHTSQIKSPRSLSLAAVLWVALGLSVSGCGQSASPPPPDPAQSAFGWLCQASRGPNASSHCRLHVAQLGDSVAAGEGTLYGFWYDRKTRSWSGGTQTAHWTGRYRGCHDSPLAYGRVVSRHVGARFFQFACSGASIQTGIEAAETLRNHKVRPPQFGTFPGHVVRPFRRAKPDVVLVTVGANSVGFSGAVTYCAIHRTECTYDNPGQVVTRFVAAEKALPRKLQQLAWWLRWFGKTTDHRKPVIVFTDYYNPFAPDAKTCGDQWYTTEQSMYMASLLRSLNVSIKNAVRGVSTKNGQVRFVELQNAFDGHTWCTKHPWIYGISIGIDSLGHNPAPFHPTPAGQRRIADLVLDALVKR